MYRWVDEGGLSAQRVVRKLNEMGVKPRKRASRWAKSSVLRSEVYAGVWYYNKHQLCEPRRVKIRAYRRSPRSSNRLRPKREWLPVELPEKLRIVNRDQWQRVQERLNRNVCFSQRNAKHLYLLAGLVKCGGCEAAYVGDPCHGRFSYRCSKRCKKYPAISEVSLGGTVWNAVTEALQNPEIIVQAIKDVRASRIEQAAMENDDAVRGLQQIEAEEARIILAYRTELLSPDQLSRELKMLRARREALKTHALSPDPQKPLPPNADVRNAIDWSASA